MYSSIGVYAHIFRLDMDEVHELLLHMELAFPLRWELDDRLKVFR